MPRTAKSSDFKTPDHEYARTIPCETLSILAPFQWVKMGFRDLFKAPFISLFYGLCFAVASAAIEWLVYMQGSHLIIFPSLIVYMLIGPFLALGLYDASWQIEKNHKPKLLHSIKAIRRNGVSQWSFALLLCVAMIFWMRIAALLHALYPEMQGASLEAFLPFLVTGSVVGILFSCIIFAISAFSIPLMMERKVDMMTAVFTSYNAVKTNLGAMAVWATIIIFGITLGFLTAGIGMLITMPILGYATWHGYRSTIRRKH
ncbi:MULTISPECIES: DUF2189 domain-containing protein [Vibrio]|uniref:DUF2189 domain-containing protein n=1 Tax=Vibrio casei TaxID=673372 RepID=A0A368LQR8_9VIBR|nr:MULTISPECIES: DUF2189 domain-containing protein [Vibrio]RCS73823.1 DUF2189 domain-containing protein [Vibrio casei]SJN35222.1 Putative cytochrome c oxidase, subunit I [Vibrio casei]HBV77276.1 DUF2189 domain-containing protein [Vibrio sp.]